ncbi:restriction endonuclease subunit M [Cytobacillus pseudoceanisediminis]|uniref:restriction endonuclease subunit M n=1 Tax=Cytobacillus pseudoceanisediminis TaxID=3051614 RepID=UPI003C30DE0B
MNDKLKIKILKYLKEKDPNHTIVEINEEAKTIKFNENIKCWNPIKFENEGYIRAYLVVKLIKELDYPMEYIELEKHYNIGSRPTDKSAFLDILVRDKRNNRESFLFIECKSPNEYERKKENIETQLFNMAGIQSSQEGKVKYLVYYSLKNDDLEDNLIIIDFEENSSYKDWKLKNDEKGLNIIPKDYEISYHAHFAKINAEDANKEKYKRLNVDMEREDFWKLKTTLHNVLWGGGSSNYNDVFYYLMHLFLAKIYDELWRRDNEVYDFQIFYEDGKKESAQKTFDRIEKLYRNAQAQLLNQPNDIIEKSTFIDLDKLALSKVISAVRLLQGISLTENKNESDILGEFFEEIVSTQFKQDKGQFFTSRNLIRFILEVLDIKEEAIKRLNESNEENGLLPYIIDPSCGSGTFLLEAMKAISNSYLENKDKVKVSRPIKSIIQHNLFIEDDEDKNKINTWAQQYIYGIEPNIELATATKVNMILHGDGNANIFINNGLAPFKEYKQPARITAQFKNRLEVERISNLNGMNYPVNEQFDYIISNPPFSLTFGDEDEDAENYKNSFLYAKKKNSENLFIERWYQLLKEKGRIGVVLPDSIFDTTENKYIRLFLLKYFKITAIVSVDKIAFQPYTSTKVSILFASKRTSDEVKEFERLWEQYTKEYLKLRNSTIIQFVLTNEELLNGKNGLIKLCQKYEIEASITGKLLNEEIFSYDLRDALKEKIVPIELSEELEAAEFEMNHILSKPKIKTYSNLSLIPYRDKDKEQKKEFNSLKKDKDVLEFLDLKKKVEELNKEVKSNKDMEHLNRIEEFVAFTNSLVTNEKDINILKSYLKGYFPTDLSNIKDIIERAYDEVIEVSKQDYPDWMTTKAKQHQAGFVNSWWVYGKVVSHFDSDVFYAEADNLGYKRTKKGLQIRPNDLYSEDETGEIIVNKKNPTTVLDRIKAEELWK